MANSTTDPFDLKPHHCGIYVPDLESSISWYHDKLDFTVHKRMTIPGLGKIAFIKHGDFFIELFEVAGTMPKREDAKTYGTKHMAFVVRNFCQFMETIKQRGVEIIGEGKQGNLGVAFIKDNVGTPIEIVEIGAP